MALVKMDYKLRMARMDGDGMGMRMEGRSAGQPVRERMGERLHCHSRGTRNAERTSRCP